MGGRVEDHGVAGGAGGEAPDVGALQRRGAAERRRPGPLRRSSCASRARRARCRTRSTSCSSTPGCSSTPIATVAPASITRRASRVRLAGGEVGGREERRHGVARRRARRCRRRSGRCSGRPTRTRTPRRAARPARGRAGSPCRRSPRPAARPASSTARHWSASNAPVSQNASIHRACGGRRVEHVAAHQLDVVVGAPGELGRQQVGAEERRLGRVRAGDAERAHLVGDVQPVPRLDLDRRRPAGAPRAAGGGRAGRARRSDAARVASVVTLIPPPSYGSPAIRAVNSSARSPANTRWVWRVDEPRQHARPVGVDPFVGDRPGRTDGPTASSTITTPARRRCRAAPARAPGRW